jgi:hypothetical protein
MVAIKLINGRQSERPITLTKQDVIINTMGELTFEHSDIHWLTY